MNILSVSTARLFRICAICAAFLMTWGGLAHAQMPLGPQNLEIVIPASGGRFLCWQRVEGRTYFLQVSTSEAPLQKWVFLPLIEAGTGPDPSFEITTTAPSVFFRLKFTDDPIPLGETPESADFDLDGLSNNAELNTTLTDPLERDTDGDGLDDGWETQNSVDPNDPTGANGADGDPDNDGLSNILEQLHGADPNLADSDADGLPDGIEAHTWQSSPVADDSDLDGLGDFAEVSVHGTSPSKWDTDWDTLGDGDEALLFGTNPLTIDSDGDWMWDDYEIDNGLDPTLTADGLLDADADTLPNKIEFVFTDSGFDPMVADDPAAFPWAEDPDWDGLTTQVEFVTHLTNPRQNDTDLDFLNDGWEIQYSFAPTVSSCTHGPASEKPDADPDGDGLRNEQESTYGTNPNSPDTDGDGVNDKTEMDNGSDPTNADSKAPPPHGTITVNITFGDDSPSHSEKYRIQLTPLEGYYDGKVLHRENTRYGVSQTETFRIPKGAKYRVEFLHVATDPSYRDQPIPDYDYTLKITFISDDPAAAGLVDDQQGILGNHSESDSFFAQGKMAYVYTPFVISETVATLPIDRARKKLGVGEEVTLTLNPSSLDVPDWTLGGTPGTSTISPTAGTRWTDLKADGRACAPIVQATANGVTVSIKFDVVEPDGVVMQQESGTGIYHNGETPSVGFKGRAYFTPFDVSFIFMEVREGQCAGTGTGYYAYQDGLVHPHGSWIDIVEGTPQQPSKENGVDTVQTGSDGPFDPAVGEFDWPIPWLFRVGGTSGEKQFAIVTHHHECDATGKATISKGGFSASKNLDDQTSSY